MSYPRRPPQPGGDAPGCAILLLVLVGICAAPFVVTAALVALAAIAVGTSCWYTLGGVKVFFDGLRWAYHRPPAWTLPTPRLTPPERPDDDPAVLGYFGGVARADHAYLVQLCRGRGGYLVRRSGAEIQALLRHRDFPEVVGWLLLAGGMFVGLVLGGLVGAVVVLGCLGLHSLIVGAAQAGAWTARGVLRAVDRAAMLLRGVRTMTCPLCYERIAYPAYQCRTCTRVHRDIRPGRHGVLRRLCLCGTALPTLLILGTATRLSSVCPHCQRPLRHRPGETREFVLPLFGAAGAGKTRLMMGLHAVLERAAAETDAHLQHADADTRNRLRGATATLVPERQTNPTPPGRDPRAMQLRYTVGRRALLLQLYDAAGERFDRTDSTQPLTYLGKAATFVLAVDPLSVDAFWRELTETERDRLAAFRSVSTHKELAYQQTYQQIEHQLAGRGRGLRDCRIAVVLTRGDLIAGTTGAPAEGQSPADWARDRLGFGNLLTSIDNNFGDWAVFHTSAVVSADGAPSTSLTELLTWLLRGEAREVRDSLTAVRPRTPTPPEGS